MRLGLVFRGGPFELEQPPAWVTHSPLLPLALRLFTDLYLFVLPHATQWRSGPRTD